MRASSYSQNILEDCGHETQRVGDRTMVVEKPEWKNPCSKDGKRLDFGHLGGTSTSGDPCSFYPELWSWLINKFDIHSVFDIGCGTGFAMEFFHKNSVLVHGIDCEQVLQHHRMDRSYTNSHDLTTCPYFYMADLVWCCEVAEHISESHVDNIVQSLVKSTDKVLAFCAAPKGCGGYNHVNCQDVEYWIELLTSSKVLQYKEDLTLEAKSLCNEAYGRSPNNYFKRSGAIFLRE